MKTQSTQHPLNPTFRRLSQALTFACVVSQSQPLWADQAVSYTYDTQGHILTEDGPRIDVNDITTHTYNTDGTRTTTTNALGHITRYNSYDTAGRLTSVTDPNGITTDVTYNPRGWVETVTVKHSTNTALNAKTTYGYDAVGQLTRVQLPNGMATNYEYTDARQLKAVTNDLGERIDYELDLAGNRKKETIKSTTGVIQYSLTRAFDELSRVMDITGNNGQNLKTTYDVNDNPRTQTDAKQSQHSQEYDALNRVKKVIDPNLKETGYTYDAQGNIQTVTDARGHTTRYDYDELGNLKTLTSPDTGVTQFTYDEAGNLKTRIDARGVETRYTYDALNRVLKVIYPSSTTENITYTYDSTANGNLGKGRLTGIQDPSGTSQWQYNYLGQLTQKTYNLQRSWRRLQPRLQLRPCWPAEAAHLSQWPQSDVHPQ
jgi:YD repeat-containing protein